MVHAYGWMGLAISMTIVKVFNGTWMPNVRKYPKIVQLMDPNVFLLQIVLKLIHKEGVLLAQMENVLKDSWNRLNNQFA